MCSNSMCMIHEMCRVSTLQALYYRHEMIQLEISSQFPVTCEGASPHCIIIMNAILILQHWIHIASNGFDCPRRLNIETWYLSTETQREINFMWYKLCYTTLLHGRNKYSGTRHLWPNRFLPLPESAATLSHRKDSPAVGFNRCCSSSISHWSI